MSAPAPAANAHAAAGSGVAQASESQRTDADMNHIEAWKGVVDFTKTVMSMAAALLAALVSYVVVNGHELKGLEFVSPALLVAAVLLSLYGFGQALSALKSGTSSGPSILLSNAGALALIAAICAVPFTLKTESSIDEALARVELDARKFPVDLAAKNVRSVEKKGDVLLMSYEAAGKSALVTYSVAAGRIDGVKDTTPTQAPVKEAVPSPPAAKDARADPGEGKGKTPAPGAKQPKAKSS